MDKNTLFFYKKSPIYGKYPQFGSSFPIDLTGATYPSYHSIALQSVGQFQLPYLTVPAGNWPIKAGAILRR